MKYIYRVHNLNIDSSGSKGSHVLYTSLVHAHRGIMIPRVAHITLEHFIVGVRAKTRAVYSNHSAGKPLWSLAAIQFF